MASEHVKTFTDTNFEQETKNGVVLVDFWAEWCGPCRRIAPAVEAIAQEYQGRVTVGKMNVDENPDVPTSRFQVRGIPTLVVLKNGELVDTIVGIAGKDVITGMLDKHLA
jgi:thioredoxin 1